MALTKNRNTQSRQGNIARRPLKAGEKIYAGALVCLDDGLAVAGKTALGLIAFGRSEDLVDNTNGGDGDKSVDIERNNVFGYVGSGVTIAGIGKMSYVVDDETVAADDGGGTRSEAGIIHDVSNDLVWVKF